MEKNRFSKLNEVMAENLKNKQELGIEEEGEVNNPAKSDGAEDDGSESKIKPDKQPPSKPAADIRLTRKTTSMPLVLDLAIKELKERRNLVRQVERKEKGKTTEDDIMIEALEFFFNQEGEFSECLAAANNKLMVFK